MQITAGAVGVWKLTLLRPDGVTPETGFASAATLSASIWDGEDQAALLTVTPTWIDATAGTIRLALTATQSATLDPGRYHVIVSITASGDLTKYSSAAGQLQWLDVVAGPGSATTLAVYGTLRDLLTYVPAIQAYASSLAGTATNFLRERARARSWLDDVILVKDRPRDNVAGGVVWGSGVPPARWSGTRVMGPDSWLRDQIDDDALIVRDSTREIVSRKAAAYAFEAQLGQGDRSALQRLGIFEDLRAEQLLAGYTAEIDTDADGTADIWIPCGVSSSR